MRRGLRRVERLKLEAMRGLLLPLPAPALVGIAETTRLPRPNGATLRSRLEHSMDDREQELKDVPHRPADKSTWPKGVGGRYVAAMAALLAVAGNAAFAQDHKTYRCKVADVVRWDDDGRLRPDSNPSDWLRQLYDGVIIDTMTGAVTYPDAAGKCCALFSGASARTTTC